MIIFKKLQDKDKQSPYHFDCVDKIIIQCDDQATPTDLAEVFYDFMCALGYSPAGSAKAMIEVAEDKLPEEVINESAD